MTLKMTVFSRIFKTHLHRQRLVKISMNYSETGQYSPVCVKDFIYYAEKNIRPDLLMYYQSGATNEFTLLENEKSFNRYLFLPRMLRDVSKRSLRISVLGDQIEHPFGIAPTASHKIAHQEGELASCKAAAKTGTPFVLSTLSSVKLEQVAQTYLKHYNYKKKAPLWFQLYVFKDRDITRDLIQRAVKSGFTAIFVTVDTPISGIRYQNLRYKVALPPDIKFANLVDYFPINETPDDNFFSNIAKNFDDSLTWDSMLKFLRETTSLPIILKGILTVDDAKLALDYGVDGIVVSNHGGRQLDTVPSTLECLSKIASKVPKSFELYLDGGVRSGDDILKALALGAKMVFIGRPVLWALSYDGSDGVIKLINILRNELNVSLALNGICDANNVSRDLIIRASEYIY